MKKLFLSTGCFVVSCIIILFILNISLNNSPKNNATSPDLELKSNLTYVVKEYNGNVAVFVSGKDLPFRITDVSLDELPSGDQKLLKTGIIVSTQEELNSILEDYCS